MNKFRRFLGRILAETRLKMIILVVNFRPHTSGRWALCSQTPV